MTLLFILASCALLAITSYAAEDEKYVGECDCAFTVEEAHGDDKVAAIESATAQVSSGISPEKTMYFSGKSRRRNISDGYYTITETSTDMCFNVDADGANTDYEGIRLTVWEHTEDITQRFRLVMNEEDGSYTFYAACSRGGAGRAVGYDPYTQTLGLYSADSDKCVTFYIKNSSAGNGMKYIVLSTDETMYLSIPKEPSNGSLACLAKIDDEAVLREWKISNWGDSAGDQASGAAGFAGDEFAIYPGSVLCITQGPYGEFSHGEQNAIDMTLGAYESVVAPFTCRVVAINPDCCNAVWIQSVGPVMFADGTYDYMTCVFLHDNDISDIYPDMIILQGQPFYEMGTTGNATGDHVHISCYRGEYSPAMRISNPGPEVVNAWDAFFLPNNIEIRVSYDYPWVYVPEGVSVQAYRMTRPEAYAEGYAKAAARADAADTDEAEPESKDTEPAASKPAAPAPKPAQTTPKPAETTAPKPAETTAPEPVETTPEPADTAAPVTDDTTEESVTDEPPAEPEDSTGDEPQE